MIERYTRPRMKAIWELKHKYEIWLEVELQACAAFEKAGQAPRGTSAKIRKKAKINVERIADIEKVTKHDVIAFLDWVAEQVGPALDLRPDLVSVYAGGNDIMRPSVDVDALVASYAEGLRPVDTGDTSRPLFKVERW